jgi:hypothetical protein
LQGATITRFHWLTLSHFGGKQSKNWVYDALFMGVALSLVSKRRITGRKRQKEKIEEAKERILGKIDNQ